MIHRPGWLLLLLPSVLAAQATSVDWPVYGGNSSNTRYSQLSQITPANVDRLQVAWTYQTHDEFPGSEMQSNPIVVDGVLYATTPKLRVVALDAATGREIWTFDPNLIDPRPGRYRHRGVTVHEGRVFVTHRNNLWALDARTGKPIDGFGDHGRVDLRKGLDRPFEVQSVSASTPGVVFGDLYILGSSVGESLPSSPGDIRAYDVHTGALRWVFHTIPRPGEYGYETWPPEAYRIVGGANAWAGLTVDPRLGMVFAATGSAAFDFYGANRIGDNLFANSVIALDARSGKRAWHFQTVKHDLWDMDLPSPPALVTVTRNGRPVEAVAQITKTGFVFVLDRRTGESLFPIEYRRFPASTLPGEQASVTQPIPLAPPPLVRQTITEEMLTTRTPAAHDTALAILRRYPNRGMFIPPSREGNIVFPGYDGGAEWGGPAYDPETGLLYVNVNEMGWLLRMIPRDDTSLYQNNCASCHQSDRRGTPGQIPSLIDVGSRRTRQELLDIIAKGTGRMPGFAEVLEGGAMSDLVNFLITGRDAAEQKGANPYWLDYRNDGYNIFLDHDGYPAISPPWGTLNAVDLNSGTIRWRIPFGEYPALAARGMTDTGTDSYGGPVVTANGLLFIGATTYDRKFHVYDKQTGKLLWETELPAAGNATPSLYMVNGKQYVVIACGGGKNGAPSGGTFVAFALP
ncbi:MAG: PQQ-binding-like beta-propeller repeat protein [Gemmatimonadota bacterium]|jgi:quinoprotein glucose dehydrogenase|nr:PQQ-binding-like beta-propeller repeat protein [Gemmatimonadota bacterium]